jgi:hypothetical protein
MTGPDLQDRLERIERRQLFVLLLVVYPYLVGAVLAAMHGVETATLVAVVLPGVGLIGGAYLVALYRARRSASGGTASGAG